MTSSFSTYVGTQRDAPPDISDYNYKKTDPDLTKSVSESIDETNAQMAKFWDAAAAQANQYHKNKQSQYKQLTDLTQQGLKFAAEQKLRNDAAAVVRRYYDQGDNNLIVSKKAFEDVTKNETELELSLKKEKEIKKQAQTESKNADREGLPFIGWMLRSVGLQSSDKIAQVIEAAEGFDIAFERVANTYKHQLPDGSWITRDQVDPSDIETFRYVHRGITEVVISEILRDNPDANKRLIQKYIVNPAYQKYETDKAKFVEAGVSAEKEAAKNARKTSLNNDLQTVLGAVSTVEQASADPVVINARNEKIGDSITDYLDTYHGFHDFNRKKGKEEFFEFLTDLWENGKISDSDIQAIGEATIKPLDGGKRKVISEYWKKEFGDFTRNINTKFTNKVNVDKQRREADKNNSILDLQEKWNNEWKDYPLSEKKKKLENEAKTFNQLYPEGHTWLDKVLTNLEEDGTDSTAFHKRRIYKDYYENNIPPTAADLQYFEPGTADYKAIYKMIPHVGLSSDEKSTWEGPINSAISTKTLEDDGNPDKSRKWHVMSIQANKDFSRFYWSELSKVTEGLKAIPTDEQRWNAQVAAEKIVNQKIKDGDYDQLLTYPEDLKKIEDLKKVRKALSNDATLLNSKEYWEGEEPHLLAALKYLETDEGGVPEFYHNVALGLRTKKKHKKTTGYEVMKDRLLSTGLINKELEPIPERVLDLEKQNKLLNKPSPAKSLGVFGDLEGTELEGLIEASSFQNIEQLTGAFRDGATVNNAYVTPGLDWIQLVNIQPELLEQYNEIIGENSPFSTNYYMHLDNLLPGVAEEQVKRALIEPEKEPFDMATLGQPVSPGESWKQTGIAQTIESTQELVMSALTDRTGNLNATGRVLKRIISGKGARDVEQWVATAPIGKILILLEGILDGPTMEKIEQSTK